MCCKGSQRLLHVCQSTLGAGRPDPSGREEPGLWNQAIPQKRPHPPGEARSQPGLNGEQQMGTSASS
eukprot:959349-Alexandrium_andersonii.AAC.1